MCIIYTYMEFYLSRKNLLTDTATYPDAGETEYAFIGHFYSFLCKLPFLDLTHFSIALLFYVSIGIGKYFIYQR